MHHFFEAKSLYLVDCAFILTPQTTGFLQPVRGLQYLPAGPAEKAQLVQIEEVRFLVQQFVVHVGHEPDYNRGEVAPGRNNP